MKNYILWMIFLFPITLFSQSLIQLTEDNNYSGVVDAVQKGADINQMDYSGFTALHIASWNGYEDIAHFLLQQGASPVVKSSAGNMPIRFATPTIRNLLLRYGAYEQEEENIQIPLFIQSTNVYIEQPAPPPPPPPPPASYTTNIYNESNFVTNLITEVIVEYDYPKKSYDLLANVKPRDSFMSHNWDIYGNNSIHQAARDGDIAAVLELVEFGVNPKAKNPQGDTALRFAAENNHLEIVQFLVEDIGIDINEVNSSGSTALIFATLNNNIEMVEYLLHMGANPNQTASATVNRTVGDEEVETTITNWSPLMAGAQLGNIDVIDKLIQGGANLNATDSDNWNSLMFAAQNGLTDTAQFLIDQGINYNIESKDKHTALSLARDSGNDKLVAVLEKSNALSSSVPLMSYDETTVEEMVDGGYEYIDGDVDGGYADEEADAEEE